MLYRIAVAATSALISMWALETYKRDHFVNSVENYLDQEDTNDDL